ncbi:hypothetical protein BH10PLA1_BH10PLA1_02200 [soil metagenome]
MGFILPHAPSPGADVHEVADFVELLAWDRGSVSAREITSALNRLDDNDSNEGCEDDEVVNTDSVTEVFLELEKRASACGSGYPFALQNRGEAIQHLPIDNANRQAIVYRCLLLCTRLNMKSDRTHGKLDGAFIFEEIAAAVLHAYLGVGKAKALVFGTSVTGGFNAKVKDLCQKLREGGTYKPNKSGANANDGKLDAVAWIPFNDYRSGQVIIFGQCKTGSKWKSQTTQCRPVDFAKKWFVKPFVVDPLRALCVAESVGRQLWESFGIDGGLLLDRCRLVEFGANVTDLLLHKISVWTTHAKMTVVTDDLKRKTPIQKRKRRSRNQSESKGLI